MWEPERETGLGPCVPFPVPLPVPAHPGGNSVPRAWCPGELAFAPSSLTPAQPQGFFPSRLPEGHSSPKPRVSRGSPHPKPAPPQLEALGVPGVPAGEQFLSVLTPQTGSNSVKEIRGQRGRSRTSKPFRPVGFNIKPPGASDTVLISATTREKLGLERHSSPCVKNRV